jgi:SulP family sulfate permease
MKAGGKNSLALFVHALLFLVLVPPLAPLLGYIPRVVIAALLFQAGMNLFDRWTLDLVRRLATRNAIHWPSIAIDLGVILLVACVALAGQIVPAVLIGVAIAVMVFTLRMSRNVIRREQYGDVTQSRRARGAEDLAVLAAHGRSILALELEGPMFFASAELLHNRIDTALAEGVRYVILDFGRVTELDSTGARILLQAHERLRAAKCALVLCGADAHPELAALLVSHRVAEAITQERMFADRDRALEWCENDLLASQREDAALEAGEFSMERIDIFRDLDPVHREGLRGSLERREYRPGETIFEQGEEGDALYVIARGSATVCVAAPGAPERRLMTFSQGTFFGEMALLDRERRSATLKADDTLICYVLQRDSFERFAAAHPQAALAVVASIGREISLRMRRANRALLELS